MKIPIDLPSFPSLARRELFRRNPFGKGEVISSRHNIRISTKISGEHQYKFSLFILIYFDNFIFSYRMKIIKIINKSRIIDDE